jgi:hypothetical protein
METDMELLDTIRPIISGLAGGIVVWLLYKYVINREITQGAGLGVVQYGTGMKLTMLALFLVIGFIDYAALHAREDQRHIAYSLAFLFTASLIYVAIEVFFVTIAFDDDALKLASPWRATRKILWRNLEDYRWSNAAQWHVFYTQNDGKIRVSPYMIGTNEFMEKAFAVLKEKYPERFRQ